MAGNMTMAATMVTSLVFAGQSLLDTGEIIPLYWKLVVSIFFSMIPIQPLP